MAACSARNTFNGDRITALDPLTGEPVALFHPRRHSWLEHFAWTASGEYVVGQMSIGRVTVAVLKLNRPLLVRARRLWARIGVHPPDDVRD